MKIFPFPMPPGGRARRDAKVKAWLGDLFADFSSPLMWKGKYYEILQPPHSVTFPICQGCGHVIWDWPHFEEAVPEHAMCDECTCEDEQGNG